MLDTHTLVWLVESAQRCRQLLPDQPHRARGDAAQTTGIAAFDDGDLRRAYDRCHRQTGQG